MKKITILLLIGASLNAAMIHAMGPGAGAGAGGPAQQQQRRIVPLKVKAVRAVARALYDGQIDIAGFGRRSPIEKVNILRQYRLMYGEDVPKAFIDNARGSMGLDKYLKQVYRFSIQELLDAGRIPADERDELNLSRLYIGSLNGLENVPNRNKIDGLDLRENQIQAIPLGVFEGFDNLNTLLLGKNQIETIPTGVFKKLDKLEVLDLSDNRIRNLQPKSFEGLARVDLLKLEGNQIETITPGAFDGLKKLNVLNLSGNKIQTISTETFRGIRRLAWISLKNNQIPQEVKQRLRSREWSEVALAFRF